MNKRAGYSSLAVLVAVNVLNFYDRHVLGALTEPIRKEFGLSDAQVGLIGSAFIWLYALVGLPLGRAADSWSRKKLLSGGMVVWAALSGMASMAASYTMLLLSAAGIRGGRSGGGSCRGQLDWRFVPGRKAFAAAGALRAWRTGRRVVELFLQRSPGPGIWMAHGDGAGGGAGTAADSADAVHCGTSTRRGGIASRADGEIVDGGNPEDTDDVVDIASGALLNFNMYSISTFLPAFLSRIHGLTLARSGIATGMIFSVRGIAGR